MRADWRDEAIKNLEREQGELYKNACDRIAENDRQRCEAEEERDRLKAEVADARRIADMKWGEFFAAYLVAKKQRGDAEAEVERLKEWQKTLEANLKASEGMEIHRCDENARLRSSNAALVEAARKVADAGWTQDLRGDSRCDECGGYPGMEEAECYLGNLRSALAAKEAGDARE